MIKGNHASTTLGIDLGGTKVKMSLVDGRGKILSAIRYPTSPNQGPDKIISSILSHVNKCQKDAKVKAKGLGLGIAGQVTHQGVVRFAPNLKWNNVPLKKILEENLDIPVFVVNDVCAATWGEWYHGAGKGVDDLLVLFVGTGIGGGVVSGGTLLEGCNNSAGELGHTTIIMNGRKCHCPNNGCLEAYAGGWAIAERTQESIREDPTAGQFLVNLAGTIGDISAIHISRAFQQNDPLAVRIVEDTGRYLSTGIVGLVNIFNPCKLVLGGGVIEGLPNLISIIRKTVKKKALQAALEKLKVSKSVLGNDAGTIGAATLAQYNIN